MEKIQKGLLDELFLAFKKIGIKSATIELSLEDFTRVNIYANEEIYFMKNKPIPWVTNGEIEILNNSVNLKFIKDEKNV
jgi:hypothetical protein